MSAAARRLRAPLAAALLLAPLAHSALHAGEAGEKPPWRLANTQAGFAIRVPARFKSHTPGAKNRVLRTPLAALTLDPPDLLAPSEFVADYDPRLPGRPPPYLAVLAVPFPGALRAEDLETYRARLQEYAVRHKLQQTPPVLEILERAGEAALRIELEDRRAPETVVRVVSYLLVMQGRLYEIRLEHPPEKMDQAERELQLVFASLEPFGPEDLKPPPAKTEVQAAPREAPPPPPQAPPAGTDWLRVALWTGGAFVLGILLHLLLRWLGRKAERQP